MKKQFSSLSVKPVQLFSKSVEVLRILRKEITAV